MSYFERHIFFCTNQRPECKACCQDFAAMDAKNFVKAQVKTLGLNGKGKIRVNAAGCLDRCDEGPVAVVYPEGTWYTYVDEEDLSEIVTSHLQAGVVVERLKLPE